MITQKEYNVTKQRNRTLHAKIYLLNFNFQRVDELSGIVHDGATFSNDATSDIRRTCNITITPTDSSFDVAFGNKIWIDKYVKVFIGIEDLKDNNDIVYTNMGVYLVNNSNKVYSAVENTITINGVDLMARLTGLRDGNLEGVEYQIKADTYIRRAMKAVLDEQGFTNYSIRAPILIDENATNKTPSDISISVGGTAYNLISELRDINTNWQTYFDVDGRFIFNQIPSGKNEQIMVDDDIWKNTLISYNTDTSFEEVKNYVEVWGKVSSNGIQPHAIAQDLNPDSPFYVNGTMGKVRIVLSGGEYDNITTYKLATDRAKYELYTRCKLKDQIQLTCVPIYWLDVNWVISITLPNKQGKEETNLYITKKIDTTLGVNGTQNITLMRYYPLYP